MKIEIYLIEQNQNGQEETIKTWTVVTDSVNRALQMYEDELDERSMQRLAYKIIG